MKKTKAISIILTASMMMTMTGCSGNKKKILAAANEYAKAVLSADIGDIAEFMVDDDEFEEAMESFMDKYSSKEDLEDIYDFILEHTTYEINKKSVQATDLKGSVEITYTMIDYMDVYNDLDDDADLDDFLDALEEAEDITMEIDQEVEFKLSKDEWKIVDDDNEGLLEVYAFYDEIYILCWGSVGEISVEAFINACENVLGDDDPYSSDGEYLDEYFTLRNDVYAALCVHASTSQSQYVYEEYYESIIEGDFEGTASASYDETSGYIVCDGYCYEEDFSGYSYGGVYYYEGSCVVVMTSNDDSDARDRVDEFLVAIGCPLP